MDMENELEFTLKLPRSYRACFVPLCKNNSKNSPSKVFVQLPSDSKRRKLWFKIARRSDEPSNSKFYCCQDHLNLEEDLENFVRFRLYGGPIKIKSTVVPRFFDCQPDRTRATRSVPREAFKKLEHQRKIKEILSENLPVQYTDENQDTLVNNQSDLSYDDDHYHSETENIISVVENDQNVYLENERSQRILQENLDSNIICAVNNKKFCDKRVQVNIKMKADKKHFKSVGVQCCVKTASKATSITSDSEVICRKTSNKLCQTINLPLTNITKFLSDLNSYSSSSNPISTSVGSEYIPSSGEVRSIEDWDEDMKRKSLNLINYFICKDPKRYIGVPENWLWIIDNLQIQIKTSANDIKLTLQKIRLNDSFVRLSNDYGMSATKASNIFNTCVLKLASVLKNFIYFPDGKSVKKALPIPFRANFSNVQATIDAFEIEIEKPSNPVNQAATWSSYKHCNTIKFLISCSPDGMINFISAGYGGRISDTHLFEICGIMETLPNECTVMADRGFKQIDSVLKKKKCKLVRPPSVAANSKLSKEEVKETKKIASLRIHIERVIRRIREFEMLEPHACVNHCLVPYIDSVVLIAAALANLQSPIIKT